MSYAAQSDIEAIYGVEALALVADRDGDGAADAPAVAAALARASDEIDLHIGAAYALPLPATPPQLVQLVVDIAVYRLALDAGVRTDEHRQRYEDALGALKRVAEGRARLTLPPGAEPAGSAAGGGAGDVILTASGRLFTRDTLRSL